MAWLQLIVSLLLTSAIVWGYVSYQASVGQFVRSVAASVGAMSNVIVRTAETVEARQELLTQTGQMLVVTRALITELRVAAENQVKVVPKYAESVFASATIVGTLSGRVDIIGEKLKAVSLPSIHMNGMKPVVTMLYPMDKVGQEFRTVAENLNVIGQSLSGISETIGRDGARVGSSFIATSEQALKVLTEVETTLARLNTQDLPKAIADLKATSENLHSISAQIDMAGKVGLIALLVGLLLAVWCLLHSVGALMLARSQALGSSTTTTSLAPS